MTDPSPEDIRLFREAAGDVEPMPAERVAPYRAPRRPVPEQRRRDELEVMADLMGDAPEDAAINNGDQLVYARDGVSARTLRRLRRGHYAVQAELDLHGRTVPEAREILIRFLREARRRRWRCVRVIHGKGLGSAGRLPVLKGKIDNWLRRCRDVLAFCSTPPHDGGTGALYVLLANTARP